MKAYLHPEYYDIAFDFRDLRKEDRFLTSLYRKAVGRRPRSMVDLACGPAYHAIHFSRKKEIKYAFGIDHSPAMVVYAREKNARMGGKAEILLGDIINFRLPDKVDLAICMIASFHLLLTNDAILKHLDSVASNLTSHGLYVIELQHPRDHFENQGDNTNVWEMEREGVRVFMQWGRSNDRFDPITQIQETTVTMQVTEPDKKSRKFVFKDPYRIITYQEFQLLVRLSGKFRYLGSYGKFNLNRKLDNSSSSWRMLAVLQKSR